MAEEQEIQDEQYNDVAFSKEARQANMQAVVEALEPLNMDFNTLVFTLADTIHSLFLNGAVAGTEAPEREQIQKDIVNVTNDVIDVLDKYKHPQTYDIVAISGLIMDAVESATLHALAEKEAEE